MKRVLIDLYKIKDPYSGLGVFSLHYAEALIQHAPKDMEFHFLCPGQNLPMNLPEEQFKIIKAGFQHRYFPGLSPSFDLWHSLWQFPSHLPPTHTPWIVSIHDLNFLFEKSEQKIQRYTSRLQKLINRSRHITTISEFTKKQIEQHLDLQNKPVRVIYNGIPTPKSSEIQKPDFIAGGPFFFSIGICQPKKNFKCLLPLMKHFPEHQLIIAGNSDTAYGAELKTEVQRLELTQQVIFTGPIDETTKYWLYKHCEALLFPSIAEGFGMPVIEAMQEGKPVFLSRLTALPEIGGKLAYYFDSFDEADMTRCLRENLAHYATNRHLLEMQIKMHAEQFTWRQSMLAYVQLYQEILWEKTE